MELTPDTCQYREGVREREGAEIATCRLLERITGIACDDLCAVRSDNCAGCCKMTPSSTTRINGVIAARLYLIAREVIARGGVSGCDVGKAAGIEKWAEQNLYFWGGDPDGEPPIDLEALARRGVAKDCMYFGRRVGSGGERSGLQGRSAVFECRHPAHGETTESACFFCRDWTLEPQSSQASLREALPPPQRKVDPPVRRWAVGVTTAPRGQPTLALCLDSLIRAGWTEPRLFVDGPVDIEDRHAHLPVSLRAPRVGAWPNYYLAMAELMMREPEAEAYFLVQDDTIFHDRENLRAYVESILWPEENIGAVSLYCPKPYTRSDHGWHEFEERWLWGALAFVFPPEAAKRFVADREVLEHRWRSRRAVSANIDTMIGNWAIGNGLKVMYPSPSLAQHIGDVSTLWTHGRALGARRASVFLGDGGDGQCRREVKSNEPSQLRLQREG